MTTLPITEPGVYADIPLDTYHGQLTDTPSISSSGLRKIDALSALHFWTDSYLNPDREAEPPTPAQIFGSAAHALVLGDEVFEARHTVSPYDDFRSKEAREWKAQAEAAGRYIIKRETYDDLKRLAAAAHEYPLVKAGILDGEVERSLVWRDEETGVWLKARPDVLPRAGIIVDYKTTVSAHPRDMQKAIADHGYHVQLALVREGLLALGIVEPKDVADLTFALVFQEKKAPFALNHCEIDADWLFRGSQVIRRAVRRFAQCVAEGVWPGYEPPTHALNAPVWQAKQYADDEETGRLPKPGGAFEAAMNARHDAA